MVEIEKPWPAHRVEHSALVEVIGHWHHILVEIVQLHFSQTENYVTQFGPVVDLSLEDFLSPRDEKHAVYNLDLKSRKTNYIWSFMLWYMSSLGLDQLPG